MCGCMLMHIGMHSAGHEGHTSQSKEAIPAARADGAMHCAHCGFPLEGGYAFCPNCGMALTAQCPSCGRTIKAGWKTCAYCGASLKAEGSGKLSVA